MKAWCPIIWVKKARQRAVEDLTEQGGCDTTEKEVEFSDDLHLHNSHAAVVKFAIDESTKDNDDIYSSITNLSVLARNQKQVEALCEMIDSEFSVGEVIIEFLEVDGMFDAVATGRKCEGAKVVLATPRIIKPGEKGIWKTLLRLEPDGLLIRPSGLVHTLQTLGGCGANVDVGGEMMVKIHKLMGDFSLNAINTVTSSELLDYGGLSRLTAGYDLSASAITELAKAMHGAATKLEVIAPTHLPIFHTEHCVFARFLSKGSSCVDCGQVRTNNNIHLRDQSEKDKLVLADMGCHNTVFSTEAQSGIHILKVWAEADRNHSY